MIGNLSFNKLAFNSSIQAKKGPFVLLVIEDEYFGMDV